jgi:hypothetical protein
VRACKGYLCSASEGVWVWGRDGQLVSTHKMQSTADVFPVEGLRFLSALKRFSDANFVQISAQ